MSNEITKPGPDDDGFSGSLNSGRLVKGTFLKWNDTAHWQDRDGLTPPSPLLVIAINEALQMWKNGKATVIADKPLAASGRVERGHSRSGMGDGSQ